MNRGLFGFDGVAGRLGVYQSPYAPLTTYGTLQNYVIEHPFERPAFAQVLLRCKSADVGHATGDETLYICTDSTATTNGVRLRYLPYALEILFKTAGFSLKNPGSGVTAAITASKWDLGFLVLG